jgi:uncharacterized protein YciI
VPRFPPEKLCSTYQKAYEIRRGDLLLVGTFADPQKDGSMSVFRTREAAEEFAREDPFVLNGVVRDWRVLDWNEILDP